MYNEWNWTKHSAAGDLQNQIVESGCPQDTEYIVSGRLLPLKTVPHKAICKSYEKYKTNENAALKFGDSVPITIK